MVLQQFNCRHLLPFTQILQQLAVFCRTSRGVTQTNLLKPQIHFDFEMQLLQQLQRMAEAGRRKLQFILAVPARRYAELGGTLEALRFVDGLAEGRFAEQRLVVAHDPLRAAEQAAKGRERIAAIEAFAKVMRG